MSILARYHIHLDITIEDKIKKEGKSYLISIIKEASSIVFHQAVDVNIEYKDGSIHYFIEVAGILFTGISGYGAIRSFIDYSIRDAKTLRDIIKNRLLKNGLPQDQLIEFRKLEASSDRVKKLMLHIDRFIQELPGFSYIEMSNEIRLIGKKLDVLAYELDNSDFKMIINNIRSRNIKQLDELYRDISKDVTFGQKEAIYFPFS